LICTLAVLQALLLVTAGCGTSATCASDGRLGAQDDERLCVISSGIREAIDRSLQSGSAEEAAVWLVRASDGSSLSRNDPSGLLVSDIYPGGLIRPLILAALLDSGASSDEVYDAPDWYTGAITIGSPPTRILDAELWTRATMSDIVSRRLNVVLIELAETRLGGDGLVAALIDFGLTAQYDVRANRLNRLNRATIVIGQQYAYSPQSILAAYGILAGDGRDRLGSQVVLSSSARSVRSILRSAVTDSGGYLHTLHGRTVRSLAAVNGCAPARVEGEDGSLGYGRRVSCSAIVLYPASDPTFVVMAVSVSSAEEFERGAREHRDAATLLAGDVIALVEQSM